VYFPSPVLPGSGPKGIISARLLRHPLRDGLSKLQKMIKSCNSTMQMGIKGDKKSKNERRNEK
jgi:hypothetical protein